MTPKIAVTLGDPLSINIEMVSRCLRELSNEPRASSAGRAPFKVQIIGSVWHWRQQRRELAIDDGLGDSPVEFVDIGLKYLEKPAEQLTETERGYLAVRALEYLKQDDSACAVLTSPIDKHACQLAGFAFPGQTEFFETLWGGAGIMVLAGDSLRVGLVTNHLALRAVPDAITEVGIVAKATLLMQTLRTQFGVAQPRIAVCGLNPHCGDGGLFGDEDQRVVMPAVAKAKAALIAQGQVLGPFPADTVFYEASQGRYDAVLALYHDQGLGPLKVLHFDSAINLTGGLRKLRASPDHGPARQHYLHATASPKSFFRAWHAVVGSLLERGAQ